jgi:hypothetical protein
MEEGDHLFADHDVCTGIVRHLPIGIQWIVHSLFSQWVEEAKEGDCHDAAHAITHSHSCLTLVALLFVVRSEEDFLRQEVEEHDVLLTRNFESVDEREASEQNFEQRKNIIESRKRDRQRSVKAFLPPLIARCVSNFKRGV